ncbi:hypothetical protein FRC08_017653 [Ceratobasidium sp. 394]|nr:hypothetical protein FRC08_017653 [Ceratobasidium sp. 394]
MSKRKGPGGYLQSDDESSDHETPPPKKPYVPPILSRAAQPTRTFQLPGSASAPPTWSSARSQPKPSTPQPTATPAAQQPARAQAAMPTPADTPASREREAQKAWDELDEESPPASPSIKATSSASAVPTLKGKEVPPDLQSRRRFAMEHKLEVLEKDVNDLKEVVSKLATVSKTQSDSQDAKLQTFITTTTARFNLQDGKLDRLIQLQEARAIPTPVEQPQPHEQEVQLEATDLVNPPATHDLRMLVANVCSSTAIKARAGKDKEATKDNEVNVSGV